ncbi:MAG: protein translocase subunit SecD [Lachnospiraceae bacterium]|jgi:SecD/SecF fusion protein|nr:protein translocase subunit SecD [Lachnospiraceae bacterium]
MKKSKGALILLLAIVVLGATSFFGARIVRGTTGAKSCSGDAIGLGLDLAGGVSITYEVEGKTPTTEQLNDTIYKLQQRVQTASDGSITEAQVYAEGNNRINVDIPGGSSDMFAELQEPGKIEFRDADGNVQFTGEDIKTAEAVQHRDQNTQAKEDVVELTLTDKAAKRFYEYTAAHVGDVLAIYYNDEMLSDPRINGAISGGVATVSGNFDKESAEKLASFIRIGTLDLTLKQLQAKEVSAQLGVKALSNSVTAAGIGLAIVMVFMIIMYLLPGFASAIGLAIYTGLMMIALKLFGITLTLPGIAGIILSMGMAVDANVVIFARIREELAAGKSVTSAIKVGYKKALSAVVDGNVTTLIAAIVLGMLGSGTVKGFAYTFGIGIILSMFTAIVITRYIMQGLYACGFQDKKFYGEAKERASIDFVGKRVVTICIAVAVIAIGFIFMGVNNSQNKGILNYSLEFMGGTSTTADFGKDYTIEQIDEEIVPVVKEAVGATDVQTQKVSDTTQIVIKTKTLSDDERKSLDKALIEKLGVEEKTITFESISSVVSNEMRQDAIVAVAIALVLMLIYIWFRFKDIRFSAAAVIALLHDVLVVLACYSVARISVGNTFIAVMLTIVGYSINATIVIFDRIRENLNGSTTRDPERLREIVNRSITQTLSRSINTSITTFVMVACLYAFGVLSIREFSLPLMVGIVAGAYSSVCLTGPIWYMLKVKKETKNV